MPRTKKQEEPIEESSEEIIEETTEESSEAEAAGEEEESSEEVTQTKRSFRCVDLELGERRGRYNAKAPLAAATKAFGKIWQRMEANGQPIPKKMNVYVVESTQGSKRKVYGYVARRRLIEGRPSVVPRFRKETVMSFDEDGNPALDENGNPALDENGKPYADEDGNAIPLEFRYPYLNNRDMPDQVITWKEKIVGKDGKEKTVKRTETISNKKGEPKQIVHCYRNDLKQCKDEIPPEVLEIARPQRRKRKVEEPEEEEAEEELSEEESSPKPKKATKKPAAKKAPAKKPAAKKAPAKKTTKKSAK